ncbi:MAG TPA: transposase [Gemmataceae bacterium]|nr:transposase [Gemmataceae bacterium]
MSREQYPSDLTDEQWRAVEPLIPRPAPGGRKREVEMREVVNAIRYLLATNCSWRELPAVFPNRSTVRYYYDAWRQAGVWERIEETARSTAAGCSPDNPDYPDSEKTANLRSETS